MLLFGQRVPAGDAAEEVVEAGAVTLPPYVGGRLPVGLELDVLCP